MNGNVQSAATPRKGHWLASRAAIYIILMVFFDMSFQQRAFSAQRGNEVCVLDERLEQDPGWLIEPAGVDGWAFGIPQGVGVPGDCVGPLAGFDGPFIYSPMLNDKPVPLFFSVWLTTPVLNCSGLTQVTLSYYRWPGTAPIRSTYMGVNISEVSSYWSSVWFHDIPSKGQLCEQQWTFVNHNIRHWADYNPEVQIRWLYEAGGKCPILV